MTKVWTLLKRLWIEAILRFRSIGASSLRPIFSFTIWIKSSSRLGKPWKCSWSILRVCLRVGVEALKEMMIPPSSLHAQLCFQWSSPFTLRSSYLLQTCVLLLVDRPAQDLTYLHHSSDHDRCWFEVYGRHQQTARSVWRVSMPYCISDCYWEPRGAD